jgi:hypothetical protein
MTSQSVDDASVHGHRVYEQSLYREAPERNLIQTPLPLSVRHQHYCGNTMATARLVWYRTQSSRDLPRRVKISCRDGEAMFDYHNNIFLGKLCRSRVYVQQFL